VKKVLLHIFLGVLLFGGDMLPFNSNYVTEELEKFDFVYPEEYAPYRDEVVSKVDRILKIYEKSFGYKLRNRLTIFLASSKDEINNGYTANVFGNRVVLFNGGSGMVDYFASKSWIDTLLYHELAHSFQLNSQKDVLSQMANDIFGSAPTFSLIHIFPNLLLPDALLEGNSVLNESLFGNGGRLFSGRAKALFLNSISKLTKERFINNHLDFPFMEEKYIVGGFFNFYLYQKFGIDKVNSFFYNHSENSVIFTPLFLNSSFENHFGESFDELFEEFLKVGEVAKRDFKLQSGFEVLKSLTCYPISKGEGGVYLTSSDRIEKPRLYFLSKYGNLKEIGKSFGSRVFEDNGTLLHARSGDIGVEKVGYGLWRDDEVLLSDSKIYLDKFQNEWLYFDINSSFIEPHIWSGKRFIGVGNSYPIFGKYGEVLYFKQIGESRVLMKDGKELFSFKGFYSRVLDTFNGGILFIANSLHGSGLYFWKEGKFFRVGDGDNIVDGKVISGTKMVLTTLEEDGYSYKIFEIEKFRRENPVFWSVGNDFRGDSETLDREEISTWREYTDMEYANFSFLFGDEKYYSFLFSDPIGYNTLSLSYLDTLNDGKGGSISYSNFRYIVKFTLSYLYWSEEKRSELFGSIYFPFYKEGRESLNFLFQADKDERLELSSGISFSRNEHFGNAISSDYNFHITPFWKEIDGSENVGGKIGISKDIFDETYFSLSYSGIKNLKDEAILEVESPLDVDDIGDIAMNGLSDVFPPYAKSLQKISSRLEQNFNFSTYFFKFPISLRRESIYLQYNYLLHENREMNYIDEKIVGVKFEPLFLHRVPLPISVEFIDNSFGGNSVKFWGEFGY
jgi:hypothetical protein